MDIYSLSVQDLSPSWVGREWVGEERDGGEVGETEGVRDRKETKTDRPRQATFTKGSSRQPLHSVFTKWRLCLLEPGLRDWPCFPARGRSFTFGTAALSSEPKQIYFCGG